MTLARIGPSRWRSGLLKQVPLSRIKETVKQVSIEHRVSVADITGVCREPAFVAARWEAWGRLAQPGFSIASIARHWGCDRSTILNALNNLEARKLAA